MALEFPLLSPPPFQRSVFRRFPERSPDTPSTETRLVPRPPDAARSLVKLTRGLVHSNRLRFFQTSFATECIAQQLILDLTHRRSGTRRRVIESAEVQQSMQNVEPQFILSRGTKRAGLTACRFGADHDFAMVKSEDISRTGNAGELLVQFRHLPVTNNGHTDHRIRSGGKSESLMIRNHCAGDLRERLELGQANFD